jgi:accessory colonization factor AcfC
MYKERISKLAIVIKNAFTEKEIDDVNRTARSYTAVGPNATVPKVVRVLADKNDKILDFGAGPDAAHVKMLRNEGYDVIAYDFGKNISEEHDEKALDRKYDIVYVSNVLNVQSSENMLRETITSVVKKGGIAIANYPKEPRKSGLSDKDVKKILEDYFKEVKEYKDTDKKYPGKIWILEK